MKLFNFAKITEGDSFFSLEKIFSTIEAFTGMEVSMYSTELQGSGFNRAMKNISFQYRKHMSDFCCIVRSNKTGRGCFGHDNKKMVQKAIKVGEPFVNICHAGIAEVIFPVFGVQEKPVATVHIGQAVTENIAKNGFPFVMARCKHLGVDDEKLKVAFQKLPHISSSELLNLGKLADLTIKGLISYVGPELFEYEIRLTRYPAIRQALEIIHNSDDFTKIVQTWIAEKVFLNPAYFSRLFKEAIGCTFSDYLIRQKIEMASSLLQTTDLSIMEIATRCNYSSQSYFTYMFKLSTGMTPSQCRKNK